VLNFQGEDEAFKDGERHPMFVPQVLQYQVTSEDIYGFVIQFQQARDGDDPYHRAQTEKPGRIGEAEGCMPWTNFCNRGERLTACAGEFSREQESQSRVGSVRTRRQHSDKDALGRCLSQRKSVMAPLQVARGI